MLYKCRTFIMYEIKILDNNRKTTLGENVHYPMHNCNIVFTDWFVNINILCKKIFRFFFGKVKEKR